MAKCGYSAVTGGAVALAAATAKTVLGVKSPSGAMTDLQYVKVSFDGVTASAVPVLIEYCYLTWATNSPGTNSSSVTPAQTYGRVTAVGATAGKTWTSEPTVITVLDEGLLSPNGGVEIWQFPLGTTYDCALGEGFGIRLTAPAIVNVRVTMYWERG